MRRWTPGALEAQQHPPDELLELARDLFPRLEHVEMRQLLRRTPGGHVRDTRDPEPAHAPGARRDPFRHRGHPHGIGPEPLEHPDFRGRLERRPEQAGVHALFQRDPLRSRNVAGEPAERWVVGIAHVGEALVPLRHRTHERVLEHQVDVVRDEHQRGRAKGVANAARRVGDHERSGAESGEHPRGERGDLGRVTFIQMKATALHDDRHALERPADELALVARGAGLGEARDLLVWDPHGVPNRIGHAGEAGAEHDRGARLELAEALRDDVRRRADPVAHNRIPASVADRKFASVPAIIARNPSLARSCLRSGTSAPMPPIWMPTELMFAKPHSANVAMVKDSGSSWGFRTARSLNAKNSLSTMRSPSRLPIVPESCHGTPIAKAIGRKTQPRIVWTFSGNHVTKPCTHPKPPFTSATRATNDTSMAMTLSIRCR